MFAFQFIFLGKWYQPLQINYRVNIYIPLQKYVAAHSNVLSILMENALLRARC